MADKHGKPDRRVEMENPDVLHESSDVNVSGIVGFGLGLAVCMVLSGLAMYGIFGWLREGFTPKPVRPSPLIGVREPALPQNAPQLFPEPRLQVDYSADLKVVQKRWDEHMETYGWVDKRAGIVHIPIDEAMDLTLKRGLPARGTAAPPPTAPGTRIAGSKTTTGGGPKLVASRTSEKQ